MPVFPRVAEDEAIVVCVFPEPCVFGRVFESDLRHPLFAGFPPVQDVDRQPGLMLGMPRPRKLPVCGRQAGGRDAAAVFPELSLIRAERRYHMYGVSEASHFLPHFQKQLRRLCPHHMPTADRLKVVRPEAVSQNKVLV
jgi:hypothetical protein